MQIEGLQKLTLLDFPSRVACTVFFGGCNFRCPFCHNGTLVKTGKGEGIELDTFFSFLKKRQGILDGVAISGGEPLLQKDLPDFLYRIKEMGFAIKLDTNGSYPQKLRSLVEGALVDYVAMDIKAPLDRYDALAGTSVDKDAIAQSVAYLLQGGIDYEFRTTLVKPYHTVSDMEKIGEWIKGAKRYFLQGFVDSGDLIGQGMEAFSKEEMAACLKAVQPFVPCAVLRGM
ncbi:MAG: anaerobic ribonucleoside-triphosphate reductase activating protein [Clostridia bacterium]|nr:anaerobic ribonucleoside-triphosphate reductase activating protein [Clostridia bacterium]